MERENQLFSDLSIKLIAQTVKDTQEAETVFDGILCTIREAMTQRDFDRAWDYMDCSKKLYHEFCEMGFYQV